jgi:hypothetical protein
MSGTSSWVRRCLFLPARKDVGNNRQRDDRKHADVPRQQLRLRGVPAEADAVRANRRARSAATSMKPRGTRREIGRHRGVRTIPSRLEAVIGPSTGKPGIARRFSQVRAPAGFVCRVSSASRLRWVVGPRTARSQVQGGVVWGIGAALSEGNEVDRRFGGFLNADIAEYVVRVNADIGSMEVGFINKPDLLFNGAASNSWARSPSLAPRRRSPTPSSATPARGFARSPSASSICFEGPTEWPQFPGDNFQVN